MNGSVRDVERCYILYYLYAFDDSNTLKEAEISFLRGGSGFCLREKVSTSDIWMELVPSCHVGLGEVLEASDQHASVVPPLVGVFEHVHL